MFERKSYAFTNRLRHCTPTSGPSARRTPFPPSGSGSPVCSSHHLAPIHDPVPAPLREHQLTFVNQQARIDLRIFSPASRMRSNAIGHGSTRGSYKRSARNAEVCSPGTTTRHFARSSRLSGCEERRWSVSLAKLPPQSSRIYLSRMFGYAAKLKAVTS